tara:strand:- start:1446 stop:1784 length:339 start_codon:yes stop_codon:yes gene_type:complete
VKVTDSPSPSRSNPFRCFQKLGFGDVAGRASAKIGQFPQFGFNNLGCRGRESEFCVELFRELSSNDASGFDEAGVQLSTVNRHLMSFRDGLGDRTMTEAGAASSRSGGGTPA